MLRTALAIAALPVLSIVPVRTPPTGRTPPTPHLVVVRMVDGPGSTYAFQPATIAVIPGDTVRFEQETEVPHDVELRKAPGGAKLPEPLVPFLTAKAQQADVVIDKRFTTGTYKFVCLPHEQMGMTFTLTVDPGAGS